MINELSNNTALSRQQKIYYEQQKRLGERVMVGNRILDDVGSWPIKRTNVDDT